MNESLHASELRPVGGTWSGLLFEKPAADYPLALTWTFTIEFAQVRRDLGSVSPSLTIDWVPTTAPSWLAMQGQHATCAAFGEPIEPSLSFFEHHRYENLVGPRHLPAGRPRHGRVASGFAMMFGQT